MKEFFRALGRVNLDEINEKTRPEKKSKEERAAFYKEKDEKEKEYNRSLAIADVNKKIEEQQRLMAETGQKIADLDASLAKREEAHKKAQEEQPKMVLKLNYLQGRKTLREKYKASEIGNAQRQQELSFQGIRPQKMDVVHFHVAASTKNHTEEKDGVALVRDENHYYLAVDMYDHPDREDNTTTMIDDNPDGTFDGIWPKGVVLREASKFEERYMRSLADKYADDLDKAGGYIACRAEQEQQEIETLQTRLKEMEEEKAAYDSDVETLAELRGLQNIRSTNLIQMQQKLQALTNPQGDSASGFSPEEESEAPTNPQPDYEPMEGIDTDTDIEIRCPHLPYLRGKRKMTTMLWPAIGTDEMLPWLRYRLMTNVARLMHNLQQSHALTYMLTEEYCEELRSRANLPYKGMQVEDVVPEGGRMDGAIVYPNQGYEDTLLYSINRRPQLSILIVYIREGRLMFYESYSMQEILGHPRTDTFICKSLRESGTDQVRLFSWLRNFVVSFLAMERDMERTVNHLVEEGQGSAQETDIGIDDAVDTTDDRDIVVRDASWYTDITVNRAIPVRGYLSHRWCGKGKEKHICEVWVRPHLKSGYHRTAKIHNS